MVEAIAKGLGVTALARIVMFARGVVCLPKCSNEAAGNGIESCLKCLAAN